MIVGPVLATPQHGCTQYHRGLSVVRRLETMRRLLACPGARIAAEWRELREAEELGPERTSIGWDERMSSSAQLD